MNNHVILVNGTTKNTVPMEIVTIAQNLCQRMIAVRIGKGWSRMNEIEKAIMDLQEYIGSGEYNGSNPPIYLNTANLAIPALEKQIPKKIDHDYLSCNSCDGDLEVFARMDIVHCPWCGQRLDWSVEE